MTNAKNGDGKKQKKPRKKKVKNDTTAPKSKKVDEAMDNAAT